MVRSAAIKVRLDSATHDELEALAKARGEGISVVVREAIRIYLATTDENIPPALRSQTHALVANALRRHARSKS